MTKGLDFYTEQSLLQQSPDPALPFTDALSLSSAAKEKLLPKPFWHVAPGKQQTLSKPPGTTTAAFGHTTPTSAWGLIPHIQLQGRRVSQKGPTSPSWVGQPS